MEPVYLVEGVDFDFLPIGEDSWCYRGIGEHEVFIQLIKDKIVGEKTTELQQFLINNEIPVLILLIHICQPSHSHQLDHLTIRYCQVIWSNYPQQLRTFVLQINLKVFFCDEYNATRKS